MEEGAVRVQLPSVRLNQCSSDFHKASGASNGSAKELGYQIHSLHRPSPPVLTLQVGSCRDNEGSHVFALAVRLPNYNQPGEVRDSSPTVDITF